MNKVHEVLEGLVPEALTVSLVGPIGIPNLEPYGHRKHVQTAILDQ